MRRLARALVVLAATGALAFLLLPIFAIFARTSPATLLVQLRSPVAVDALLVSLQTSALAHVLILAFGTPTAYALATGRFRGRRLAIALVELPLVLPPAVAGLALLAASAGVGFSAAS